MSSWLETNVAIGVANKQINTNIAILINNVFFTTHSSSLKYIFIVAILSFS